MKIMADRSLMNLLYPLAPELATKDMYKHIFSAVLSMDKPNLRLDNKRPPVKPVVLLAPPIRGLAAAFSRRRWSFVGKERFRQSLSRRQFVNWWTTTRGGGFLLQ
jgi:hypothetical protein